MKLLTHNFLTSKCLKRVNVGFPLGIVAREVKECEIPFDGEFISKLIPKVDWDVLCTAAASLLSLKGQNRSSFPRKPFQPCPPRLGQSPDLPKTVPSNYENDEEFLRKAHHVLLEVQLISGDLICPETGVKFPVSNGIPNMLANEDEV